MLSYSGPANPASLEELHRSLTRLWADIPDVDQPRRIRFATAVAEIVANVIAHGRTPDGGTPTMTLSLSVQDDRLHADLVDDGIAPHGKPDPDILQNELAETGRGLILARELLDELSYSREDGRNHWTMAIRGPSFH